MRVRSSILFVARTFRRHTQALITWAVIAGCGAAPLLSAQNPDDRYDRYDRNGRYDAYTRLTLLEPGTFIRVRTEQTIDTDRRDGHVFPAVVESDVWDDYHRLAIPAIPRGAPAELLVRTAPDGDLILDMDSVIVDRQRYAVATSRDRVDAPARVDRNQAPAYVGGGALLGTIIGAIAGGGKGAAVGAVAGAAVGASLITHGKFVRVPAGSVLTFRLERGLAVGVRDDGYERDGVHYHR
jgi:hypothetical protein